MLLIAFGLNSFGKLKRTDLTYNLLNCIGAFALVVYAIDPHIQNDGSNSVARTIRATHFLATMDDGSKLTARISSTTHTFTRGLLRSQKPLMN